MAGLEFNYLLLGLAFFLLGIASWQDFKSREVVDWIWYCMIGGGMLIHAIQVILLIITKESPVDYVNTWVFNFLFAFLLGLFIIFSGLMGEADGFALVAIAMITPVSQPIIAFTDPQYEIVIQFIPRILGTFFNAHLFAISAPLLILCYNLVNKRLNPKLYELPHESLWVRFAIRFVGYPHSTDNLSDEIEKTPWHFDFLEEFKDDSIWKIVFRPMLESPEADIQRKKDLISLLEAKEKKHVWIQPSSPGIFFLTLGFIADIFLGNIIMICMALIVN